MAACASLLCDNCKAPGRCCIGFDLAGGSFGRGETALETLVRLATVGTAMTVDGYAVSVGTPGPGDQHVWLGLPFMPLWRTPDGAWRFWCPVLGPDGRCGDYDRRPALCRHYEAGTDTLCAMHVPTPVQEASSAFLEKAAELVGKLFP